MSDKEWKAITPEEGWPAGVTAHHAAESMLPVMSMVQMLAEQGQLPPITPDQLNGMNADHAKRAANCTKEETLELARTGGEKTASYLRGLSDEQLAKSAKLPMIDQTVTAQQLTEMIVIGHLTGHGASLTEASA
jgi:hypothetical protein